MIFLKDMLVISHSTMIEYNSEHVLFYLENKSIKYVEHVPVVKD